MLRPEIVLGASGLPAQLLLIVEQGPRAGLLALRTPGDAEMSTLPPSADISWLCRSEIRHPGPLSVLLLGPSTKHLLHLLFPTE